MVSGQVKLTAIQILIKLFDPKYVTVWAKTRHVRTQTEIHFIAPAFSYTK